MTRPKQWNSGGGQQTTSFGVRESRSPVNLPLLIKLLWASQRLHGRCLERLQHQTELTHAKALPLSEHQWCLHLSAHGTFIAENRKLLLTRGELKI
jgi:hypothetical protein